MKLREIRNDYERYSTKVSEINRQLIFAGIAIVWLFRMSNNDGNTIFPIGLHPTLLFFIFSFGADILQYFFQSVIWFLYYWYQKYNTKIFKNKDVEDCIVKEPEWPNIIPWLFWFLKVICSIIAYYKLGVFLNIV